MDNQKIITKLNSVKTCLMAHPHNEPHSEFADRIDDLMEIIQFLKGSCGDFYKVFFKYDKNAQGRAVWVDDIRIFSAFNPDELHQKINAYMRERTNDVVNRWYYMKMINIERL
jgi:hypothetical protein